MKHILIPAVFFLIGVAAFVALLILVKGGLFAVKRKKTKLGLVKVAGAGLKLDGEDEPEGSDGLPADAGVNKYGAAGDGADAGAGVNTDTAGGAADSPLAGAVSDGGGLDGYGEDAEYQETLAVPLGGIDDEGGAMPAAAPAPPKPVESKPAGGDALRLKESRPFGDKLPMIEDEPIGPVGPVGSVGPVRKIVETPVENPFLGGKTSSLGDAKKTSVPQRRRLPETVKMKDRKVILAEDVAINRDLIAMYFDGSGVKFEFAVNGREVCEKFERDPGAYSLILMDIQMPEMDGYEVSRRIRAMDVDWAKQIPIIAMTGNDQKEDIDLCFEAGMDDHIPKPIDMEVLQEKVFDIITLNAESY